MNRYFFIAGNPFYKVKVILKFNKLQEAHLDTVSFVTEHYQDSNGFYDSIRHFPFPRQNYHSREIFILGCFSFTLFYNAIRARSQEFLAVCKSHLAAAKPRCLIMDCTFINCFSDISTALPAQETSSQPPKHIDLCDILPGISLEANLVDIPQKSVCGSFFFNIVRNSTH